MIYARPLFRNLEIHGSTRLGLPTSQGERYATQSFNQARSEDSTMPRDLRDGIRDVRTRVASGMGASERAAEYGRQAARSIAHPAAGAHRRSAIDWSLHRES